MSFLNGALKVKICPQESTFLDTHTLSHVICILPVFPNPRENLSGFLYFTKGKEDLLKKI